MTETPMEIYATDEVNLFSTKTKEKLFKNNIVSIDVLKNVNFLNAHIVLPEISKTALKYTSFPEQIIFTTCNIISF